MVAPSAAVIGVDLHVVVREIARPHHARLDAAPERDAQGDFRGLHRAPALLLGVGGGAGAVLGHQDVAEVEADPAYVQILNAAVAAGAEDPPDLGIPAA